jgi:predicted permease
MGIDRWRYVIALRLRSLFRRNRVEDDLADELRFHIDERTRELMAKGLSAREAHDAALRAFGGIEQRKEECRDARGVGSLEDFAKDLRYGARMLARTPGFTVVAVLSLAIGIGANTAIFTLIDAVLLKPLPVDRPDQLRTTNMVVRLNGRNVKSNNTVSYRFYLDIQSDAGVFSDVVAFTPLDEPVVADDAGPRRVSGGGLFVSPNYFSMLGVRPQIGRMFDPASRAGAPEQTAVLADGFWRREFGGDAGVLGKTIEVNDARFTVIGVAPAGFFGLMIGQVPDLFLPVDRIALAQPGIVTLSDERNWTVHAVGRLKPGVSDAMAAERLTALRQAREPAKPNQAPWVVEILPIETGLSGVRARFLRPLTVLMIMVALLLVIGCANVATMLLSRAATRKTEIAIRSAIGAGQGRLLRQLATESVLLVAAAGALGVVFASWATGALLTLLRSMDASLALDLTLDRRVLFFTVIASGAAALIAGLTPARHAVRFNAGLILKDRRETGTARSVGHLGRPFVVAQVSLSLALVVAAGLLARTLHGLTSVDAGFEPKRVVLATVSPAARGYQDPALSNYFRELLDRLRAAPGVEAATLVQFSFLIDGKTTGTLSVPGFTAASEDERWVQVYQVGPQFFETLGMSIVEGRDFTDQDMMTTPPPYVLNESAARRYFPGTSAVGRTVQGGGPIIAVVRDARYNSLREQSGPTAFYPYARAGRSRMTFAARVASEAAGAQTIARAIRDLDPLVPAQITTLDAVVSRSLGQERVLAVIATFFGVTALLLLSLGLYGVMAFWVTERTSEIGVRMALGAQRSRVVWSVLQRPLTFVLAGTVIGIGLTVLGSRFIAGFLFGLSPQDPVTVLGAAVLLMSVAVVAGIVPARRASRVDPVIALRCE